MEVDIEHSIDEFFNHFNLKSIQPNLAMKELLENFWLRIDYEDENGWGTYEICYSADQWFGCDLLKFKSGENGLTYERVAHGEGESPLYALMAMSIDADNKKLIPIEYEGTIEDIFTGKVEGFEYN